jgi:hypothetical protein
MQDWSLAGAEVGDDSEKSVFTNDLSVYGSTWELRVKPPVALEVS